MRRGFGGGRAPQVAVGGGRAPQVYQGLAATVSVAMCLSRAG
jgi:hypothetical protein